MKYLNIFIFILINFISLSQDSLSFSVENTTEYNFRIPRYQFSVLHEQVLFSTKFNNHTLFIGPQYSRFLGPLYDPADNYKKKGIGGNFGYQFEKGINDKYQLSFFTRLSFSLYQYKVYEHSMSKGETLHKLTILENNIYFGIKRNMGKSAYFQLGAGFGSTQGFFLMLESFMLSSTFGFGFEF